MENNNTGADGFRGRPERFPDYKEATQDINRNSEAGSDIASGQINTPTAASASQSSAPFAIPAAPAPTSTAQPTGFPPIRGRRRTTTLIGAENPADSPLTESDQNLATLINRINTANRRASAIEEDSRRRLFPTTTLAPSSNPPSSARNFTPSQPDKHASTRRWLADTGRPTTPVQEDVEEDNETTPKAGSPQDSSPVRTDISGVATPVLDQPTTPDSASDSSITPPAAKSKTFLDPFVASPASENADKRSGSVETRPVPDNSESASRPIVSSPTPESLHGIADSFAPSSASENANGAPGPVAATTASENTEQPAPITLQLGSIDHLTNPRTFVVFELPKLTEAALRGIRRATMQGQGYQNYVDSSGGAANPRQVSPSPGPLHQNGGMNGGGMGLAGGMVGFPTPAGHQSDLNYIMQMVEELSAQLAQNQGLTAGIVEKMGRVRAKAQNLDLSNDELVALAASELNISSDNIEKENSELRKALEKALSDKKENWKLAVHGANVLSDVLDKMHIFKSQHEADTLAWHRNYRKQLSDEREENLRLRNQIDDMKAAACRANEHLRKMRRYLTDHDEMNELRIQNIALRQERRLWKRKALPLIPDDDSEWSDDDDLIDPEEKKRKAAEEIEKERKDKEGMEGGETAA